MRGEAGMGFAQGFAWVWGFWGIVLLAKVLVGVKWPPGEAGGTLGALQGHSQVLQPKADKTPQNYHHRAEWSAPWVPYSQAQGKK